MNHSTGAQDEWKARGGAVKNKVYSSQEVRLAQRVNTRYKNTRLALRQESPPGRGKIGAAGAGAWPAWQSRLWWAPTGHPQASASRPPSAATLAAAISAPGGYGGCFENDSDQIKRTDLGCAKTAQHSVVTQRGCLLFRAARHVLPPIKAGGSTCSAPSGSRPWGPRRSGEIRERHPLLFPPKAGPAGHEPTDPANQAARLASSGHAAVTRRELRQASPQRAAKAPLCTTVHEPGTTIS